MHIGRGIRRAFWSNSDGHISFLAGSHFDARGNPYCLFNRCVGVVPLPCGSGERGGWNLHAPRWQPDDTGDATAGEHPGGTVSASHNKTMSTSAGGAKPVSPPKPGRVVGWIFKDDGETVAIERHECDARPDEKS
jgi:hypothetical protein